MSGPGKSANSRDRRLYARHLLLLLGWVAFVHWQDGRSAAAVVSGLAFVLAIFACVVAHEYGMR